MEVPASSVGKQSRTEEAVSSALLLRTMAQHRQCMGLFRQDLRQGLRT